MRLLLLVLLVGCRSAEVSEPAEVEPTEDIDSVGDRGHPIPFGVALDLAPGEAELLYPNLLSTAADAGALAAALPRSAGGLSKMEGIQGIQEDETAAWVGAMATYRGPGGKVTVLLQDTGWEPAAVNPLVRAWSVSTEALPDGRKVASRGREDRGGTFLQAAAFVDRPRIVVQVHANEGVSRETMLAVLGDVTPPRTLLGEGRAFPRSTLLPQDLSPLAAPKVLEQALPTVDGWTEVAIGSGWHREQRSDLVSVAIRTFLRADGVLQLSLRDLGLPGQGVTVGAKGDLEGTGAEIRRGAQGGVRCDPEVGACKSVELIGDRYVWSVVGPASKAEVQAVVGLLDRSALK